MIGALADAVPERVPAASAGLSLMLAADLGATVELHAEGARSEEALAEIVALIERRFDEEE